MGAPAETPVCRVRWLKNSLTGALQWVQVEDHDRLTDEAVVVVNDPEGVVASMVLPGHDLEVEMGWGEEVTVLFGGMVRSTSSATDPSGRQLTTITAHDRSCLMHEEAVMEDHVGTLSAVVTKVAGRHPVTVADIVVDPDPEFTDELPLRQHARTDLEFVQELAARHGARAFVERNDGTDQFYFVSAKTLLEAEPIGRLFHGASSATLHSFRYQRVASAASPQLMATTIDPLTGEVKDVVGAEPTPEPPLAVDQDRATAIGQRDAGLRSVYEAGIEAAAAAPPVALKPVKALGVPSDPALLDLATVPDPTTVLGLRGQGSTPGSPAMRAKSTVTIEGIAPWAAGVWYLACVLHSWSALGDVDRASTYETSFVATR